MLNPNSLNMAYRLIGVILIGLSVGACSSVSERGGVPVQDAKAAMRGGAATPQGVQRLNQINSLQVEIRELRNQVEEQQFEMENLRQRQQDLFQGLDQRLRVAENMQQGGGQGLVPFSSTAGDAQFNTSLPKLSDQNQIEPNVSSAVTVGSTTTTQTASVGEASIDQQTIYDQGFDYLKQSKYTDAISKFSELVSRFPNGGLADDASYWVGEANYVNRQYEAAIRAFRKVVTQYPSSDRVPEALLKVGYVQYDIGDYQAAKATFSDVRRRYADHPVAISAKSRIQRIDGGISN